MPHLGVRGKAAGDDFCGLPHFNDDFLCRQKFNDYICMT